MSKKNNTKITETKTVIVKPSKTKTKSNGKQRTVGDAGPIRGQLSSAALQYAMALANPFDHDCAGLPAEFPPVPSLKTVAWVRGTMTVGTAGFGYVVCNPFMAMANDLGAIAVTGPTFAGTTIALSAVGVTQPTSNAVYSNASFGANLVLARISAAAIRIYPTMAEVDLNGQVLAGRHPDNRSLTGLSFEDMLKYKETVLVPVTSKRERVASFWQPVNPDETEFIYDTSTVTGRYALVCAVSGTAGKTFAYECFVHVEYAGSNVQGRTASIADPEGMGAVLTVASSAGSGVVGNEESYSRRLVKAASELMSRLSGPVTHAVAAGVGGYFGGPDGANAALAMSHAAFGLPHPEMVRGAPALPRSVNRVSFTKNGYIKDKDSAFWHRHGDTLYRTSGPVIEDVTDKDLKRTAAELLEALRKSVPSSPLITAVLQDGHEFSAVRVDSLVKQSYLIGVIPAGLQPASIVTVEVAPDIVIKGKFAVPENATIKSYADARHDDVFCALRLKLE